MQSSGFQHFMTQNGPLAYWLIGLAVASFGYALYTGFFRARKIQPNGFRWRTFRNEMGFAVINLSISTFLLTYITTTLTGNGLITFNKEPATWWVMLLEYALYFFGFDTWFYWWHRLMHKEPFYKWIHKIHHRSTSPNLLTTVSESPLESLVNGGWVPLFTALFTVHQETMAFIGPTSIIMGFYVHSGYEFFPRWWNQSWATKWFITATFHDQHHKFFNWNFGGYTTLWDRICGTQRTKFESDYLAIKDRVRKTVTPSVDAPGSALEG